MSKVHAKLDNASLWQHLPPAISADETRELIAKAQQGDTAARNKAITGNLRLVAVTVIRSIPPNIRHKIRQDPGIFEDLLQVGIMGRPEAGQSGLMQAIDWFDLDKGTQFSTYATQWIRAAVRDEIANRAMGGRAVFELTRKARKMSSKLEESLGRSPSVEEITDALNAESGPPVIAASRVRDALQSAGMYNLTGTIELEDCASETNVDPGVVLDQIRENHKVHSVLAKMQPKQAELLYLYFGLEADEPLSYQAIADARGISVSAVRKSVEAALKDFKRKWVNVK